MISDSKELLPWFSQKDQPVWISVNPYDTSAHMENNHIVGKIRCIERLFFDFDDKEKLRRAWGDAQRFAENLKQFYGIDCLIVYSGKKGYHVYVFLQQPTGHILSEDRLKSLYRRLQEMLLGKNDYPTFDRQVFGDVKRVARVPYSYHQDTKNLVTPVNVNQDEVLLLPGFTTGLKRFGIPDTLVELAYRSSEPKKQPALRRAKGNGAQLRPCIEKVLSADSVHDPKHKLKVGAVAELHAEGFSREEIIDRFRGMVGFDERKTVDQVDHALRRGYRPFRCKTIKDLGGCLGESCKSYKRRAT